MCLTAAAVLAFLELGTRGYHRLQTGRWTLDDDSSAADSLYVSNVWTGQIARPGAALAYPGHRFHINSHGFRGAELSPSRPPNTLRIACIGSSTTFDARVSDDANAWPAQMEVILRARHGVANVEVVNAGTCGYSLQRSLIDLATRVVDIRPDWVICYAGINDLAAAHRPDHQVGRSQYGEIEPQRVAWWEQALGYSALWSEVASRVRYARQLKHGNWEGRPIARSDEPDPRGIAAFARNLRTLVGICRVHGIRLALVTVRTAYAPMQPMDVQLALARADLMDHAHLSLLGHYRGYAEINRIIRETAALYGLPLIDQARALPAGDMHFVDSIHFNDAGAAAMAMLAADELAPHLKPDVRPGEPIIVTQANEE